MNYLQRNLVVEGWRGINHSFAIVNQFQLLEISKRSDISLWHVDAPFFLPHWNRGTNGAGFHNSDESLLTGIAAPPDTLNRDWTYRIFSQVDLRPCPYGGRLAVFLVTELGLDEKSFAAGSDIKHFESAGNIIINPMQWRNNENMIQTMVTKSKPNMCQYPHQRGHSQQPLPHKQP